MAAEFEHTVQWTSDDERAFWELCTERWPVYGRAGKAGRAYWTGYDPDELKPGEPLPPPIQELSEIKSEVERVRSKLLPNEEPLVFPLVPYLRKVNLPVPPEVELLSGEHSLYLLEYGVDLEPHDGEEFTTVELRLSYPPDKGFLTYRMWPDTELEERFKAQSTIRVGLDPHLRFRVPELAVGPGVEIGGGLSSGVDAGLLVHWEYKVLKAAVRATGVRSGWAKWKLTQRGMVGSIDLRAVVRAPRRARQLVIDVTGEFKVKRSFFNFRRERAVTISLPQPVSARLIGSD